MLGMQAEQGYLVSPFYNAVWKVTLSLFINAGRANSFTGRYSHALTCTLAGPATKTKNREVQITTQRVSVTSFSAQDAITPL